MTMPLAFITPRPRKPSFRGRGKKETYLVWEDCSEPTAFAASQTGN